MSIDMILARMGMNRVRFRFITGGDCMPNNEKEYNGYLLDQLELIERLEMILEDNDIDTLKKQLAIERKFVERKLYQKPPITEAK